MEVMCLGSKRVTLGENSWGSKKSALIDRLFWESNVGVSL